MPRPPSKAMPRIALRLAQRQARAVGQAGDEAAHVVAADRAGLLRRLAHRRTGAVVVRDAVGLLHPVAVELLVQHGDVGQVLDPVGAVVARHHQAHGIAVEQGQVGAVHGVGQHDLAVHRVGRIQRLDELGRARQHRPVHAFEADLARALADAGLLQHARQGMPSQRALPMAPLPSCPPPTRGSKKPRLLPEHWVTATSSTGAPNFSFRSASVSSSGASTRPPTRSR